MPQTQTKMEIIEREPRIGQYSTFFDVNLDSIKMVSMTLPMNLELGDKIDVWDDNFNAVTIDEKTGKPVFHPKRMIDGKYYPLTFKNKEYLLKKSDKNIIDVYEIENIEED